MATFLVILYIPYMRCCSPAGRRAFPLVIPCEGRRAAMTMFAGLDVGFKRTAVCVSGDMKN
jgi:hypothetical protein